MRTSVLILSLFLQLLVSAQQPHPAFRHYGTADGLPSSEVYQLLQDNNGYLWISTDNGLSRFDGYEFRNFGPKDGLKDNLIFHLLLDTRGRVWTHGLTGNVYFVEGDTILPYWNNHVIRGFEEKFSKANYILVEGEGDTVHLATMGAGLISIAHNGTWNTYLHEEPNFVHVFEKEGKLVWGHFSSPDREASLLYDEKLRRQNLETPIYFQTEEETWTFKDLHYSRREGLNFEMFQLREGQYLLKHYNDTWLIERGVVRWQHYFPHNIIYAKVMNNGQFFVGLHHHEGLRIFNSVEAFRKDEFVTWLPGESVSWETEDREGGRWFATNDNGLFYAPADAFLVHDLETGLPNEKITALAAKNETELYIGLANGEVRHLDVAADKWTKLPTVPTEAFIRDLFFEQGSQQLWAGRGDLFCLENKLWKVKGMLFRKDISSPANRITQSPDGSRLWVCAQSGFMSIELPNKIPSNEFNAPYGRTFVVREDHAGRVWVGQPKGLFEWRNDSLIDSRFLHPAFSLRVEDIALAPDSTLVVATKGGGIVFWKGDRFEQITTADGLTADMMECVFTDANNVFWAGTLNGLNRISGTWGNRKVTQITMFHGLPSNEINRVVELGKTIWVATNKGLVRFSEKKTNPISIKPILKSVVASNRTLDLAMPARLTYKENNLRIEYFTINYRMNRRIPYRYRLDGGDWVQTQNRSVNYSALPPGERIFEVMAQNEDCVWSESAVYRFAIGPPWWATWWFRILAAMGTAMAAFGFYQYRTRQLKRENEMQRQITELERSALQAQMNPHFIFNCLNAIQNFILQNEKDQAIEYLGSFARLVRGMLNASISGRVNLQEEVQLLESYLSLEQLRFDHRFAFEVKTEAGLDCFEVEIPPLLIQPYVENAVLHGMAGRENGGMVEVFFREKDGILEVSVRDNGGGLASQGTTASMKSHKSVGMSITRRRLEILSDKKSGQSVDVQNLCDALGNTIGTEAIIRIDINSKTSNS